MFRVLLQKKVTFVEQEIKERKYFIFYAQANDDYIFDHWATNSNGTGTVSNSISFSVELESDRKKENNPKVYNYYAIFKAQNGLIKVRVNRITIRWVCAISATLITMLMTQP